MNSARRNMLTKRAVKVEEAKNKLFTARVTRDLTEEEIEYLTDLFEYSDELDAKLAR